MPPTEAVLRVIPASPTHPGAQVRLAGDRYIFLEYGPMELDISLRVRWGGMQGQAGWGVRWEARVAG